jgi:hypothetical protein
MKSYKFYLSFVFSIVLVTVSCSNKGFVNDFSDLAKLQDSLRKAYPDEEIRVGLNNGNFLNISFVNSELKKLSNDGKDKIAQKVGQIARSFFDEKRITDGYLVFAIYKNYLVFKYSESVDIHSLKIEVPQKEIESEPNPEDSSNIY